MLVFLVGRVKGGPWWQSVGITCRQSVGSPGGRVLVLLVGRVWVALVAECG